MLHSVSARIYARAGRCHACTCVGAGLKPAPTTQCQGVSVGKRRAASDDLRRGDACVALFATAIYVEAGEACGAPQKRGAFLGTPTRPYEHQSLSLRDPHPSCPALGRASTSLPRLKTWMAGTSPAMTNSSQLVSALASCLRLWRMRSMYVGASPLASV